MTLLSSIVNEVQSLQFELIRRASWNDFDGEQVIDSLLDNRHLWRGVLMNGSDLLALRDMVKGRWNVDTMYILAVPGLEPPLIELASTWSADEIAWLSPQDCQRLLGYGELDPRPAAREVLRVWWA